MGDQPKPDTIDVPLFADDFELIDKALTALERLYHDEVQMIRWRIESASQIAELRDRLKRSRRLP